MSGVDRLDRVGEVLALPEGRMSGVDSVSEMLVLPEGQASDWVRNTESVKAVNRRFDARQ
jgi:hypothetical protein